MISVRVIVLLHPIATDDNVNHRLLDEATRLAAMHGLAPGEMTAYESRETPEGLIEHRALFATEEP